MTQMQQYNANQLVNFTGEVNNILQDPEQVKSILLAYLLHQANNPQNELNDILNDPDKARRIFDGIGKRQATIEDYKYRIGYFLELVNNTGFNLNSFRQYRSHLDAALISKRVTKNGKVETVSAPMSAATKNKYFIAARKWLKELYRMGVLKADITLNTDGFDSGEKHKKNGLTKFDVRLVVDYLRDLRDTPQHRRLKAIMALLLFQGLRQAELIKLDFDDLDLKQGRALILGKGRGAKEAIDLHPKTVRVLRAYLDSEGITGGPLFLTKSHSVSKERLTTRGLRKIVKTVFDKLNIENSVHGCRHFFVTRLTKDARLTDRDIIEYSRHKDTDMIQVYKDETRKEETLPFYYEAFSDIEF